MRIADRVRAASGHFVLPLHGPPDEADSDLVDELEVDPERPELK
jgi:hypothetical protein